MKLLHKTLLAGGVSLFVAYGGVAVSKANDPPYGAEYLDSETATTQLAESSCHVVTKRVCRLVCKLGSHPDQQEDCHTKCRILIEKVCEPSRRPV